MIYIYQSLEKWWTDDQISTKEFYSFEKRTKEGGEKKGEKKKEKNSEAGCSDCF